MKFIITFYFIIILALPLLAPAQDSLILPFPDPPLTQIPVPTQFFTTDKLQQVYAVTPQNTVIKFVPVGDGDNYREQYRFSNNTLGALGYVDTTDPFNLLLYYPDYQVVVTLDRTLNEMTRLSLIDANVIQANTLGLSNDGNVWVYDEAAFLLKKLNRTGEALVESQNLSLLLPKVPKPRQIVAIENLVYLNDPHLGILIFNNFGQYVKLLPILDIENFQILDNHLIYKQDKTLYFYNFQTFQSNNLPLPAEVRDEDPVQVQQGRLFVRKKAGIEIYKIGH